jgi:hypothetical protein
MRKKLLNILSLPYVLGFFLSLLVFALIPVNINKDILEIEDVITAGADRYYFSDLNNDGTSEKIEVASFRNSQAYILFRNLNNHAYDQWNASYDYVPGSPVHIGNFDDDNYEEVYIFTYKNDSLFLNMVEYFDKEGVDRENIFIDIAPLTNDTPGYLLEFVGMYDANNDDKKEMYFYVRNGYPLTPRKMYRYDIANDTLIRSENYGNMFAGVSRIADVTGDGIPEIFGRVSAINNYPDSANVKYKDNSAWIFVFDKDLHLLFEPVEYEKPLSVVDLIPVYRTNDTVLVAFYQNFGVERSIASVIDVYDPCGNKLKRIPLDGTQFFNVWPASKYFENIHLQFSENKSIYSFNPDFTFTKVVGSKRDISQNLVNTKMQIGNQWYYFSFNTIDRTLTMLDDQFRKRASVKLPFGNYIGKAFTIINPDTKKQVYFQLDSQKGVILTYIQNTHEPSEIMKLAGIYAGIVLLLYLLQWIYRHQARQKQMMIMQLNRFQMLSVKNQLDPHFAFNAVNTLGSLIYGDNKEKAYNYLLKFSNLLRNQLTSSDKLLIPLENEIESTNDFLVLQSERFRNKLRFEMDVSSEINKQTLVPRLCIQTYVENAIKHGLKPKGGEGEIMVTVHKQNNFVQIEITDNGIGRAKAKQSSGFSTGKGLESMAHLYEYINKESKDKIEIYIEDLYDEQGNAAGTRVRLMVPEGLRERV